jgi:hypothetical protein
MTEPPIYRYDVTFEATEIDQGRSIVRLALSREGTPPPQHHVLLRAQEEMTPEDTKLLAQFLNQYITRFAFVPPDMAEPDEGEVIRCLIRPLRSSRPSCCAA